MTVKPSRVTIRQRLSNGEWLTMWFYRNLTTGDVAKEVVYCWSVALYIGDRKAARRWSRGKRKQGSKQTGSGSIEGLALAHKYLLSHAYDWLSGREELRVEWEDDKRQRAYRWLLRHPGFINYRDKENGDIFAIGFRHPNIWNWNETGEGAGK